MPNPQSTARSLASLLVAQALITFNASAANWVLLALVQFPGVAVATDTDLLKGLLSAGLVVPLVALAPLAGWATDRFSKSAVLRYSAAAQLLILSLLVLVFWSRQLWLAVVCVFLLAVQMTVFAPAKRAILIEIVPEGKLSRAVGLMEMLSVTAILLGAAASGRLFDHWAAVAGNPWMGALWTVAVLAACSGFGWLAFRFLGSTEAKTQERFTPGILIRHGSQLLELWQARPIMQATIGVMFFYGMGVYCGLLFMQIGADAHSGGVGSATAGAVMLLALGAGTMTGNLAGGLFSRRGVELGLIPLGGAILLASLVSLGFAVSRTGVLYHSLLGIAGFASGLFLVPLYAFIQREAGDHRRGRILAAVGLLDSAATFVAGNCFIVLASNHALDLSPAVQFWVLGGLTLAALVYALRFVSHHVVNFMLRMISAAFYRVRVDGLENLPSTGGALVICNHVSYIDALILNVACPRSLLFMVFTGSNQSWWLRLAWRATGVRAVGPRRARRGVKQAVEHLSSGHLVCIFPEIGISKSGVVLELRKDFEAVARAAGVSVIPVYVDRQWSTMFAFSGQKYFWKQHHHRLPCPVSVHVGRPLPAATVDAIGVRKALFDLGEQAFSARPELMGNLARECVRSLARRPWEVQVIDRTGDHSEIKAGMLLAVAAALSRRIAATVPEFRIGIVLPPSAGCCIANLAVILAGKVPVNMNFTAGRAAIEASMRLGEVTTVLTAEAVQKKVANFPWPERTIDIKQEILACGKPAIMKWLALIWLLPGKLISRLLGIPPDGGAREVGLLFTSGTAGEPKGVPLTHRNILGNCAQISATGILPKEETMLACLPVFHSFGFTATLWYPILRGCMIVTIPSPLDTRKMAEVIAAEKVTVVVVAPTFLRPLLKKATREEMRSIRFAVSGAEKMPIDLHIAFRDQLGVELIQGYGLTETTPVTNFNMPVTPRGIRPGAVGGGHRLGSVGRMLPGMTAKIVDADTGRELPLTSTGVVWFRGPNIFSGYLKDEQKTRAALRDGWFVTGDLGRFDEDGFLYIEGRLSRFSKIGGEMVPHGTVEQRIIEVYELDQSQGPVIAVVGVPDSSKGEALVLLTAVPLNGDELRERLFRAGLPNLWIPKIIRRVDQIPLLGSGKTDIKGCLKLAAEAAK